MRMFIVLCLLALTSADKLGYNYRPVPHADEGLSFQPGSNSGSALLSQPIGQGLTGLAAPSLGSAAGPVASAPAIEEYQKEFYSYSAPDNEFDDGGDSQNLINSLKKNLRVIFIRGPESQGLERAALQLAKQAGEQKTAIYVLQKQTDIGSLAQQLQNAQGQNQNKPEVHFVKYRTPEDAQNAQQAIQSQYDQLPGSSHSSNEGNAPVLNFASKAPIAPQTAPAGPGAKYLPANPIPQQNYLPPTLRRL